MTPEQARVLAKLLGSPPLAQRRVHGGYTPAERWVVELADGRSVFVKTAVNELTADWLRDEHRFYEGVHAPYLARLLGWADGDWPMLVLEDLSAAAWPPPWTDARVASVLHTLGEVAATRPPMWLPGARESGFLHWSWRNVLDDPRPLRDAGIFDELWLDAALPRLIEASEACGVDGDELLHLDVRSDNICFRADGSAVLVDWPLACAGNARLDIAFWLPTLVMEGGPLPDSVLPDAGPEAALVSGFFAGSSSQPPIPDAPAIRPLQLNQLRQALPWACRALGLPLPSSEGAPR